MIHSLFHHQVGGWEERKEERKKIHKAKKHWETGQSSTDTVKQPLIDFYLLLGNVYALIPVFATNFHSRDAEQSILFCEEIDFLNRRSHHPAGDTKEGACTFLSASVLRKHVLYFETNAWTFEVKNRQVSAQVSSLISSECLMPF